MFKCLLNLLTKNKIWIMQEKELSLQQNVSYRFSIEGTRFYSKTL